MPCTIFVILPTWAVFQLCLSLPPHILLISTLSRRMVNKPSLTMCSSDFVFRKYKQDSAFRASGVLLLAKTSPLVTKNFPLRRLFSSDAMMTWRFYTPYDVKRTNLHILTARGMSHILTQIGQLWSSRKNSYALVRSLNSKIMNQCNIDFNFLE